ncbi:hypothetical protein [Streptomyces albospinus]|uniref:hypothetical protein n=1 Tax=Streptomyces albospinus TaxID=285515 RepID=UPI00166FB45E|nr:hypothetical protein [Streptomyces albospinus]
MRHATPPPTRGAAHRPHLVTVVERAEQQLLDRPGHTPARGPPIRPLFDRQLR